MNTIKRHLKIYNILNPTDKLTFDQLPVIFDDNQHGFLKLGHYIKLPVEREIMRQKMSRNIFYMLEVMGISLNKFQLDLLKNMLSDKTEIRARAARQLGTSYLHTLYIIWITMCDDPSHINYFNLYTTSTTYDHNRFRYLYSKVPLEFQKAFSIGKEGKIIFSDNSQVVFTTSDDLKNDDFIRSIKIRDNMYFIFEGSEINECIERYKSKFNIKKYIHTSLFETTEVVELYYDFKWGTNDPIQYYLKHSEYKSIKNFELEHGCAKDIRRMFDDIEQQQIDQQQIDQQQYKSDE